MSPSVPGASVVSYVVKREKGLAITGAALSDFGEKTGKILLRRNHKGDVKFLRHSAQPSIFPLPHRKIPPW